MEYSRSMWASTWCKPALVSSMRFRLSVTVASSIVRNSAYLQATQANAGQPVARRDPWDADGVAFKESRSGARKRRQQSACGTVVATRDEAWDSARNPPKPPVAARIKHYEDGLYLILNSGLWIGAGREQRHRGDEVIGMDPAVPRHVEEAATAHHARKLIHARLSASNCQQQSTSFERPCYPQTK